MAYNSSRGQATSLRQIKKFGGAGYLRRDGDDRPCWVGIVDYKPRDAELRTVGARRALVAAKDLAVPPDREQDLIVFAGEVWRIVTPVSGPRPNGVPLFYDCEVVYDSLDNS
jgi:hypothetical protein